MALFETLTDTFDTFDTAKWSHLTSAGGTDTVSGGVLTLGVDGTDNSRGGIITTAEYAVGYGSQVSVKIDYSAAAGHDANFQVGNGSVGFALCTISGANLTFTTSSVASGTGSAGTVAYSPTAHAWLRMRFGVVGLVVTTYFDTSPDGVVWTQRAVSVPRTWSASTGPVFLFLNRINPSPGTCVYDNLNIQADGVTPVPPVATPLGSLTDDFNGTVLDTTKWTDISAGGGGITVGSGVLNCTTAGANGDAGVQSTSTSLMISDGSTFFVKVDTKSSLTDYFVDILNTDSQARSRFYLDGDTDLLTRQVWDASGSLVTNSSSIYSAFSHAWLRLRFVVSTTVRTYFEASPDGVTWTGLVTGATVTWPTLACRVKIYANSNAASQSLLTTFDKVNTAPPKTESIRDDFLGTTLDSTVWNTTTTSGNAYADVSGGNLNLNIIASGGTDNVQVTTVRDDWALTESSFYIKPNPNRKSNTSTELRVTSPNTGRYATITLVGTSSTLTLFALNDSGATAVSSTPTWNATTWAYWRIRMAGINVLFDRSADAVTWTQAAAGTNVTWGNAVRVSIKLSTTSTTTTPPHLTQIDSVNMVPNFPCAPNPLTDTETLAAPASTLTFPTNPVGIIDGGLVGTPVVGLIQLPISPTTVTDVETLAAPTLKYPISSLTDEFLGADLDPDRWAVFVNNGTATVSDGYLDLRMTTTSTADYAEVRSVSGNLCLTDSAVYIKITPSLDNNTQTTFTVQKYDNATRTATISVIGSNVKYSARDDTGTTVINDTLPYNATTWAYWRIRMAVTSIYIDRSADAVTWTQVTSSTNVTWGGSVRIYLRIGVIGSNAPPHLSRIDAVNMLGGAKGVGPAGITDPETLDGAALDQGQPPLFPDPIVDPGTLGTPDVAWIATEVSPAGYTEPETLGAPGISFPIDPDEITDTGTLGDPTAGADYGIGPDGTLDDETLGAPDLTPVVIVEPDEILDPDTLDNPAALFAPLPPFPDEISDPETIATPQVVFYPGEIDPVGIADPQTLGAPGSSFVSFYNGNYSTGLYGVGVYQGIGFSPTGIGDFDTLGEPGIYSVPPTPADTILPTSIIDAETLGGPALPKQGANNLRYGEGTYDEGPYYGNPATPTDQNPVDNVQYSYGTYGYGIYYGVAEDVPDADNRPLFLDIAGRVKPALHVIGIGPWSPQIKWRGAPNYNIRSGTYPARPAMALPPATSKGFTLRLGEGGEARVDLAFPRGSAVILDEMDTDLWWRRKDPRTDQLEMIGRFNVAHLAVSTSDTGVNCSTQLVDYRTILGERLVLQYLHPELDTPTSKWNIGTPAIDIIEWALPTNTGLDLTEVKTADLGKITYPFHLPPGTSIADLMDNVEAVSPKPWEWWVETPLDIAHPPKLRFVVGERGKNKGVTLFDLGTGPTPIASWQQNGASDDYANAIYYTGGGSGVGDKAGGGVVEQLPSHVRQYGQRDVLDGNSSVRGGDIKVLRERATKKLLKYADRRPSYQIVLKQGFWRGLNHIDIGDTITLYLRLGKEVLRDEYRVSELTVDIDDLGTEDVGLTLGRLPASSDPRSKRSPIARVVRYLKNYSAPDGAADIPDRDDD